MNNNFTLQLGPLDYATIDQWPVRQASLPIRLVHAAECAGCHSFGALRKLDREALAAQPHVGAVSLRKLDERCILYEKLTTDGLEIVSCDSLLNLLLSPRARDITIMRYGLNLAGTEAAPSCTTLQETGDRLRLTRERVRQLLQKAKDVMSSSHGTALLDPLRVYFCSLLTDFGGAAEAVDIDRRAPVGWFSGYRPAAILMMLADIRPSQPPAYAYNFFSVARQDELVYAEEHILRRLAEPDAVLPRRDLEAAVSAETGLSPQIVSLLIKNNQQVAATLDGRCFRFDRGMPSFLTEILSDPLQSAHYSEVTDIVNRRLLPHCRRGKGFMLQMLRNSPQFRKTGQGFYRPG